MAPITRINSRYKKWFWVGPLILVLGLISLAIQQQNSSVNNQQSTNEAIKQSSHDANQNQPNDFSQGENQPPVTSYQVPILMYHYIREYNQPDDKIGTNLSVSPTTFRQQLDWLKGNHYQTIDLDEFIELRKNVKTEKLKNHRGKLVILTFDDGYEDAFTQVMPALAESGFIGVFYITSGFLNRSGYLTKEQVKIMFQKGHMIAAHTVSHTDLVENAADKRRTELAESKKSLEALIGKPITHLAYPSGRFNDEVINLARSLGYQTAVTTQPGIGDQNSDLLTLPRIRITEKTIISSVL